MKVRIRKSKVMGRVGVPPSKSMTHRALICSALAAGESVIRSPLISDDTQATLRVLRGLGLDVSEGPGFWRVHGGTLKEPDSDLFCGESGTTLRLVTAVCSLTHGECNLTGGPSLSRRPVEPLLEGLGQLGVDCESAGGFPPVKVRGRGGIRNGEVEMRGDISSQFVSAILLVAPFGDGATRIRLTTPLESRPYVRMTMDVQGIFGVEIQASDDMRAYRVERQAYRPADMAIEGDWSSATCLLAAGALAGGVTVENLSLGSGQADAAIIDILEGMGVQVKRRESSFSVEKTELRVVEADLSDSPDLFPVVASLCSAASGESVLRGLRRLRFKESDRVAAMVEGLGKMGVKTAREGDSLVIEGGRIKGGVMDPRNDHRIAMALSILGLVAEGETTILDAGCVSKSYPGFWEDMTMIGADIGRSRND